MEVFEINYDDNLGHFSNLSNEILLLILEYACSGSSQTLSICLIKQKILCYCYKYGIFFFNYRKECKKQNSSYLSMKAKTDKKKEIIEKKKKILHELIGVIEKLVPQFCHGLHTFGKLSLTSYSFCS